MRNVRAIPDAKNVGVDRNRGHSKGGIQHHVGGFAPYAGQHLELFPVSWNLAVELLNQDTTRRDDVLGLTTKETNSSDVILKLFFT